MLYKLQQQQKGLECIVGANNAFICFCIKQCFHPCLGACRILTFGGELPYSYAEAVLDSCKQDSLITMQLFFFSLPNRGDLASCQWQHCCSTSMLSLSSRRVNGFSDYLHKVVGKAAIYLFIYFVCKY